MSTQIAVRLPEDELERLDAAVARGTFASRAAAVRAGLGRVLAEEREAQIAESYRRAYAAEPGDEEVGRAGLHFGALLVAEDDRDTAG